MREKVRKIIGIIACSWLAMSSSGSEAAFPEFAIAGFHGGTSLTLPDGRRLFVGSCTWHDHGPSYSFAVARFNSDGTPDLSFNGRDSQWFRSGATTRARLVVVQPDGKIIAGGTRADPTCGRIGVIPRCATFTWRSSG
jgi:hypothetical protein